MVKGMLKEGDRAPAFTLESDSGKKVSLKDFKGKTVILYFYPKDMTSGCTQQACDFRDQHSKFKRKDAVILGVSKDSIPSHIKFRDKYSLPFLLLSDPDTEVCEVYGVWKEKSMYGRKYMGVERTTFVISPEGKIQKIYSKVKVKGHIEEVLSEI
jgi:peroxiredoxin Q/BCP